MKEILTIGISFFYFAAILSAQEWQYPGESGGGYSYDTNSVYTDSRGFTIFENNTWDGLDYSGKTSGVDAKDSSGRNPIKYPGSLAFSALSIVNSTVKNSNFSNSTYFASSNYSNLSTFLSYGDSVLENVDFSGSKFSHKAENPSGYQFITVNLLGTVKNLNLSNVEISENTAYNNGWGIYGLNLGGLGGTDDVAENINLSSSKVNLASLGVAIKLSKDVKNLNMDNIEINTPEGFAFSSNMKTIDGLSAKDAKITVRTDSPYVWIDSMRNTFKSTDFRGATVNGESFNSSDIADAGENINTLLGNGEIFSNDMNNSINKGLVLGEGETFTIAAHEVSAKLTVDSTLTDGTIDIKDGGLFELTDGVTLTLTDQVNILFDASALVGSVNDLVLLGKDSTIVMAGYESDEAAQAAFISLFQDSEGKGVDWSPDSIANFVVAGPAIPEPSTYAAIFGALALAFAAYRRRK